MNQALPDPLTRLMITASSMAAATMVSVDMTIANVALPHMQAAMSASQDQIVWVLTSYLVAGAIATPLSGWLASRYGRKFMMLLSVGGFTVASVLCGVSTSLEMMVFARLLQGACGAGLVPLSQATLLDINPPSRHARAMSTFALGVMMGPLIGPTLGGWLTDSMSWRWVFFINLPVGVIAFFGMWIFMPHAREERPARFDLLGFVALSVALSAFQLMLDRGEQKDWFESTEIWVYAALLAVGLWVTGVHMFTARNTFIRPQLFADRNFAVGCIVAFATSMVAFGTMPMIIIFMQNLLGYSALHTGLVGAPRGIGMVAGIFLVTRLIVRFDPRIFLAIGLAITAVSMQLYARMDLLVDTRFLIITGLVQGIGNGLVFVPLSVIVFSTLPAPFRNEGAAMYALTRNVGQSLGISYLQSVLIHYTAASRTQLVQGIRPDNPLIDYNRPGFDFGSTASLAEMAREITRQASMVGNVNVYWMMFFAGLAMVPLVFLIRKGKPQSDMPPVLE